MADDAKTVIGLAVAAVAGWWVYTNFFSAPAAPAVSTPPVGGSGAGTNLVPANTGGCDKNGMLARWLAAVKTAQGPAGATFGPNLPGTLNIDEYCYYGDQLCTGICPQVGLTADALFPGRDDRGGPLNWSAFLGYAQKAGLSGLGSHLVRRAR
jgi:hypothetical protein